MNLNTFERHGVFENQATVNQIASRLTDLQARSAELRRYL